MSARPWHKRYHSDALTGFRGLNLEQRGAYQTILDLLYDSGDEALPASDRWMAGQMDCSIRKWRAIRAELVAADKITELPDGRITNTRYLRERAKRADLSATRADAGAKGGRAKAGRDSSDDFQPVFDGFSTPENGLSGKDNIDDDNGNGAENRGSVLANATAKPPVRARDPEARVQNQSNEHESLGDGDAADRSVARGKGLGEGADPDSRSLFDRVCDAAGYNPIQSGHIAKAHDQIRAWRDAGIDFDLIVIPTIKAVIANSDDPTSSLIRFDKRIRHQHAKQGATPASMSYKPPASPITDQPGEEDCFNAVRADLLKAFGPTTFSRYVNAVLFETVPDAPQDRRIMRVIDKRAGPMVLMDDQRATTVRQIARKHGFDDVW